MHICRLQDTILLGMQTEHEFTSSWDKKKNSFIVLTMCIVSFKKKNPFCKESIAMLSIFILKRRFFHETSTLRDSETCTNILNYIHSRYSNGFHMTASWSGFQGKPKYNGNGN